MNYKRIIMTVCLLFMLVPGAAMAEEEPIIYTVKEGDTLWDISQRFIKDPYYWPNLWSHNPDIGNPHLIYPGQKLRIYDGRIEIIPVDEELPPEEVVEEVAGEVPLEEIELVNALGGPRNFIGPAELPALGTLIDTVDNRLMISEDVPVFLQMNDLSAVSAGDVYELIELGEEIYHPVTGELSGYRVTYLGTVKVTKITPSVAVASIESYTDAIQRGAKVRPYVPAPERIVVNRAKSFAAGYIVYADQNKITLGQLDVIHVDIGAEDGVEVGNELRITRPRELTRAAQRELGDASEGIKLPDIELGKALVLEVHPQTSAALVLKMGNLPIYPGDRISTIVD